ncbi:MAG: FAD-dependent oxidoreductase [Verrucomicrobia bacterium]|nr:FAD-dependent oxidoreductase [Verrucomicrobiota bacterium]
MNTTWLLVATLSAAWVAAEAASTVLVEAESLADPGGWKVDSQSIEQMGSAYLIAHGLGRPVANATGTVSFPGPGTYAVWVRTRNWVPACSNAAAPGQFRVRVDGVRLGAVFGTEGGDWHWQAGGTVTVGGATAEVALEDLTGFDGRCDAMAFLADSNEPPPAGGAELAAWRQAVRGEPPVPAVTQRVDCVVVGGGMAGCCAAVAAARSGIAVALVHDRPFLGGNGSQEIRVGMRGDKRHAIVTELTSPGANRDDATIAEDVRRLAILQAEPNLGLFMPWRAYAAGINVSRRITHIDARHTHTGERLRLEAPIFIDCTGDGWIGYWAGADYRMGREGAGEYGESRAPAEPDAKTMGNSLMWKTRDDGVPVRFPAVPWAMDVAEDRAATGGEWNWEYGMSLNTITDAEAIRDHLLRAIYGNFYNAKQNPAHTNLVLDWVPYLAGKRESRRLLGDHILTQSDLVNGVYFEDAIATTDWGIDLHEETEVSYLATYTKTVIAKCFFPFRCLYSRNVPNLMMAGRCLSATHVGLGSPRVQNTCGQMGVAVGIAAALCKEHGIEPRDLYRSADRTVELQARITGAWPERPPPIVCTLDNSDPASGVVILGDWTASASTPGYYGTNYLHDGGAGQGTKRVAFTPALAFPGRYAIALRWTDGPDRASNAPVWVCPAPHTVPTAAMDAVFIRNAQPDQPQSAGDLLVGRFAGGDYTRGLLRFDVPPIPAGAVIVSAEIRLQIAARDPDSASGFVGADGIRVYRLTESFVPGEATWNHRTAAEAWSVPGGAFDPTPLTTISSPTDPNRTAAGEVFVFPQTDRLLAAVATAASQGTFLEVMVRTPTLESTYPARKVYRFAGAALVVKCVALQLPATCTVDQRQQGGQWVAVGTHEVTEAGITVVIGNDDARGVVVADAVQFANLDASETDLDGDRLPDSWERYYFLSLTGARPEGDADGDGLSNHVEYKTGTDPLDAASRFDARLELDAAPGSLVLCWPSATNATYRVEAFGDLTAPVPLAEGLPATPPQNRYRVTPAGPHQFYRVVLESAAR